MYKVMLARKGLTSSFGLNPITGKHLLVCVEESTDIEDDVHAELLFHGDFVEACRSGLVSCVRVGDDEPIKVAAPMSKTPSVRAPKQPKKTPRGDHGKDSSD